MPQTPPTNNQFYQAPLQVPGYVNPNTPVVPPQPVDIYGLLGVGIAKPVKKNAYQNMLEGKDPFLIPDSPVLDTNLATLAPLDDPAGLFHSQDGFAKYGYSTILNGGDNEDRYSTNFKKDNPSLFWRDGFHPWEGIKKGVYWGGGIIEKTLESAVVKTGQGLAGLYGMSVGNALGAVGGQKYDGISDWLARSTDNIFSNIFNNWDQNLKERYHYFQEKEDRSKKGFIASLSDGDFWMNDVSDGLGFLVSAAFEVGLVSKLGLGAKVASRMAPLAEGVTAESAVAEGVTGASWIGRGAEKIANMVGLEEGGHALIKNAVDLTSETLATTAIESASEAQEAKQKILDSFEGKVNPETGMYYTSEEKKRLAAAAAAEVFKQNMMILIGPKFLETLVFNNIGKAFKGLMSKGFAEAEVASGKASGAVRSRLGNLSSGTSYERASALKNIWKFGSTAAVGFVSEGLWEENVQLAISRTAENTFGAGDEFYRPGTSAKNVDKMQKEDELFGNVLSRYKQQTRQFFRGVGDSRFMDDELSKSIGIGGMFGVGGGAIHVAVNLRQQAKIDKHWNDRINTANANLFEGGDFYQKQTTNVADPNDPTKTIPKETVVTDPKTGQPILDETKLKAFLNKMSNIQGLMEIIANTEDPNDENNKLEQNKQLNKLARNVLFANLAMEYIRAGKHKLLLRNLAATSQFSDKDIQALGYEPGFMDANGKKEMLAKMTKMVNKLVHTNEWIDNNVIDNVSEPRAGFGGLKYTKTQKEKRLQEFEKKKEYLRGLAMQSTILDSYLDDINNSESKLGEPQGPEMLSSVLDKDGVPVMDFSVPLATVNSSFNSRIPALKNMIEVLQNEFAYHWDNIQSQERNSPKAKEFSTNSKTNSGKNLAYEQVKADEALERMNKLQDEHDRLVAERNAFLNNEDAFELQEEDGNHYVVPKNRRTSADSTLEQLQAEKIRRINDVKREEIGIQKGWIDEEWKNTAALKEEKTKAGREDTYFSRRMTLTKNAYNTYFQREVADKDNSLGQRKLRLFKDNISTKQYKNNEEKLLKTKRIEGKVATIIADVNGKKLLAEIEALLAREDLNPAEFAVELKKITDNYNGKPVIVKAENKSLVDDQIDAAKDEYNFVANIMEYMPEDDRFNDKYYDLNQNGHYVVKAQYDSLQDIAATQNELQARIDDLQKIKDYLNGIPEKIPGDWNNINVVKRKIADVYTETADKLIDTYNKLSNNGQSEVAGDSLSTKQELDQITDDINDINHLKKIFEDRDKTDKILSTPEFKDFIEELDKKLEALKKIQTIVKERLASRLRENQDFLVDSVNNVTEQIGVSSDGTIANQEIHDAIKDVVGETALNLLKATLTELKQQLDKPDNTDEEKKALAEKYWVVNGQVSAIQELIKHGDKVKVQATLANQKVKEISKLESTALMQKIKGEIYYKDIQEVVKTSLLGALQILFYQSQFSQVGVAGGGDNQFLDDQPSSPVYKFREDYNLRKLQRAVDRDESRTPENTEVSKADLQEFLAVAKNIQNLEDLNNTLESSLNMVDQVEREKEIVNAKKEKKDNKYENLIVPSVQQLGFIRNIASFMRRKTGINNFRNWVYIQAPGGAGKTQTLGTWFNSISGIPRDRVLATAFTEEAARGIKKALLVGEEGPKDVVEMIEYLKQMTKENNFSQDVLIVDEFPAIDVQTQKALYDAIQAYSEAKMAKDGSEFKVITMGDTNQLTFSEDGSLTPRPSIIINPKFFGKDVHPANMQIIPSLTVNFRSNLFAITSFTDQFKGSNAENVNAPIVVASTDANLASQNVKGVVAVDKGTFKNKIVSYIKANLDSTRTRALIVNEKKIEEYKKLLTDNGIKVITDPNDELTKGVYVTSVKNAQGFSFDEVFVDLENNDKTLFSGTANPNYAYNKAMYVAASRARSLIVVTNFPNIQNTEDDSINTLENKALEDLQTKDETFISNRDKEIEGSKAILGDAYGKQTKPAVTVKAEEKVETPLDQPEETSEEGLAPVVVTPEMAEEIDRYKEEQEAKGQQGQETGETVEDMTTETGHVQTADGEESDEEVEEVEETPKDFKKKMFDNIKDKAITVYNKVKDSVVELLFPTGQTLKYKVGDGEFTKNGHLLDTYENRNLRTNDKIILVPFQQTTTTSPRRFGYAIVTEAIDSEGKVIPNSYRTVSVLSDNEIDNFKENPKTEGIYNTILENEKRDKGFVSLQYADVYDENGFTTDNNKVINELETGTVKHANPISYFYGKAHKTVDNKVLNDTINEFIDSFYANHIASFPTAEQQTAERVKLRKFYSDKNNAQIIIPVTADVEGTPTKPPRLKVPPELRTYVRAGRPYLMFRPYHRASTQQFIALSRKFLNTKDHQQTLAPIKQFIGLAKNVRDLLEKKGVTNKMGYSKSLSNFLGKAASMYAKDSNQTKYTVTLNTTNEDGKRISKDVDFSNIEMERIYNLHSMYQETNTHMMKIETEKEIKNLTNIKRPRNYVFEDGSVIFGTIKSYDPTSKTYVVRDSRDKDESGQPKEYTKSGVIHHSGKSSVGKVQQILDDIMNSNSNVSKTFASDKSKVGFVTAPEQVGPNAVSFKGYKFMGLLGSKAAPVIKSYNADGTVKEFYQDVIDILESLFNFDNKGELPPAKLQHVDNENTIHTTEVKFRVPVPLNARNDAGELEHDYSFSSQNTSRDSAITNSKFFESNFETLAPSRVFIEFGGEAKEKAPEEVVETKKEAPVEEVQEEQVPEAEVKDVTNQTKEEIETLSFNDLRARLSEDQVKTLDEWAKRPENGFGGIDEFFAVANSIHPAEQSTFRDYLIECLL